MLSHQPNQGKAVLAEDPDPNDSDDPNGVKYLSVRALNAAISHATNVLKDGVPPYIEALTDLKFSFTEGPDGVSVLLEGHINSYHAPGVTGRLVDINLKWIYSELDPDHTVPIPSISLKGLFNDQKKEIREQYFKYCRTVLAFLAGVTEVSSGVSVQEPESGVPKFILVL
jgi:hypothetical protein